MLIVGNSCITEREECTMQVLNHSQELGSYHFIHSLLIEQLFPSSSTIHVWAPVGHEAGVELEKHTPSSSNFTDVLQRVNA